VTFVSRLEGVIDTMEDSRHLTLNDFGYRNGTERVLFLWKIVQHS